MIKCSRLEEIQSLMAIKQYCLNNNDCGDCKLMLICSCMMENPSNWNMEYEEEKGDVEE